MQILVFWLCCLSLLTDINGVLPAHTGTLTVTIENVKVRNGKIMMALYNTEKDFLSTKTIRSIHHPVPESGEVVLQLTNLEHGIYAISLFHDENNNGAMDYNFMKIPKEPYGFSNNPKVIFSAPKYDEASFVFEKEKQELSIQLK